MQKSGGVQTNLRPDISPFVKFTKADNSLFSRVRQFFVHEFAHPDKSLFIFYHRYHTYL